MTRKEQIKAILDEYAIFKGYYVKGGVGAERIYSGELADEILALPLDLPEVDEVAKQANKEYPYRDVNWNDTTIQRHAWNKCAVWMRSEILKRNTP